MDDSPEGLEVLESFKKTVKYDEIPDQENLFNELNTMLTILELI